MVNKIDSNIDKHWGNVVFSLKYTTNFAFLLYFRERKMTEEKILTRHPQGKNGRNINREYYETLKQAILSVLKDKELTHNELFEELDKKLIGKFPGSIGWYGETVKLDLEAREIIDRTSTKPQKYRLK